MNYLIASMSLGRKNLFQRTRFAEHFKHALLHDGHNLKDEIMVLGWRVYPPSFLQSIASVTHSESSSEQVGQT
jgi:hypothetical protein